LTLRLQLYDDGGGCGDVVAADAAAAAVASSITGVAVTADTEVSEKHWRVISRAMEGLS